MTSRWNQTRRTKTYLHELGRLLVIRSELYFYMLLQILTKFIIFLTDEINSMEQNELMDDYVVWFCHSGLW